MNIKETKRESNDDSSIKDVSNILLLIISIGVISVIIPIVGHILMSVSIDFNFGFFICICTNIICLKMFDIISFKVLILGLILYIPKVLFKAVYSLFSDKKIEKAKEPWFLTFFEKHQYKLFLLISSLVFYIVSIFITHTTQDKWLCIAVGLIYGILIGLIKYGYDILEERLDIKG